MKWFPDRKVLSGGLAGILAWAIMLGLSYANVSVPADTQALIATGIASLIAYLVPPADQDIVKRLNDGLVKLAQDDPNIPVTPPPAK